MELPAIKLINLSAVPSAVPKPPSDLREMRIEEFIQARSLAPKSERAYRQDLKNFLEWTSTPWVSVTPRQVAQFKQELIGRELSPATVRRILGTLKNFYGWMARVGYVDRDPTAEVSLPKLKEPEAKALKGEDLEQIFEAVKEGSLPERNLALISVLLHGLRAAEVVSLNIGDYDGSRLNIRQAKADSKGLVPLEPGTISRLNAYLQWRLMNGEALTPERPLFVSHSYRNQGDLLSYDGIRKLIDKLSEETGVNFHAHQFRHTFATNLVLKGMNPYHVMTLTRHKSVQSFKRYTKAADQAAAEAAFREVGYKPL